MTQRDRAAYFRDYRARKAQAIRDAKSATEIGRIVGDTFSDIEALQSEITRLQTVNAVSTEEIARLTAENTTLYAENERLSAIVALYEAAES